MKNLIYYTIGYKSSYIELLELSLLTYSKYNNNDNTDIIIICDKNMINECKIYEHEYKNIKILENDISNTSEEASIKKLSIFRYDHIQKYDKIIYFDSDILFHTNIDKLFEGINDNNMLYVYTETEDLQAHSNYLHSLCNYTEEELVFLYSSKIYAFNAGCFGFKNSPIMAEHFENILEYISTYKGIYFYEQSFMNTYFNIRNLTDRTLITNDNYTMSPYFTAHKGKILHFCGAPGDAISKKDRMLEYINKYFD